MNLIGHAIPVQLINLIQPLCEKEWIKIAMNFGNANISLVLKGALFLRLDKAGILETIYNYQGDS